MKAEETESVQQQWTIGPACLHLAGISVVKLFIVFVAVLFSLGCETQIYTSGSTPPPVPAPEAIGPEDVISIRVYGEEDLTGDFRVSEDGTFRFPLLGEQRVAGLTVNQLAEVIEKGLADGYLARPQVTVAVKEFNSRMVSVIGEVRQPGRYSFRNGMSVIDAIAVAGGTTDHAALGVLHVTRSTGGQQQFAVPYQDISLGKAGQFWLLPGDIIVVHESAVR